MNLTPAPPSQNSHAVRWHCTAESERTLADFFVVVRLSSRLATEFRKEDVTRRIDWTQWLDGNWLKKRDEPGCLNISQSCAWLPLLLLNQLHGQLLQRTLYESANGEMTVTSQVSGSPASQGNRERPSSHFPSDRLRPSGSLVHGMPAETIARATKSFRAWCLAGLPGAFLQTKPCSPCTSTRAPQWHLCDTQRVKPSRRPTPVLTTSSSSLNTHDDIGIAWSQSPLCGDEAAKKEASCAAVPGCSNCTSLHCQNAGPIPEGLFRRQIVRKSAKGWRPVKEI